MEKRMNPVLRVFVEVFGLLCAFVFVSPALLVIVNAFKPLGEILRNPFSLPSSMNTENLSYVITNMKYFNSLKNTVIIAVIVVTVTVLLSAMAGYKLTRYGGKISGVITAVLLSSMLVPFQSIMIPIAQIASYLGIGNSMAGYIIIIIPLYAPLGIFICQGFVKTVPYSLEEASVLDGCSPFGTFFRIVLPLLAPTLASITVLYSLWIWNDYALASMMLTSQANKTLTLTIYSFFSSFTNRWDYALAALSLSIIPITVFYLFMQKYIVRGITAGAVKG